MSNYHSRHVDDNKINRTLLALFIRQYLHGHLNSSLLTRKLNYHSKRNMNLSGMLVGDSHGSHKTKSFYRELIKFLYI